MFIKYLVSMSYRIEIVINYYESFKYTLIHSIMDCKNTIGCLKKRLLRKYSSSYYLQFSQLKLFSQKFRGYKLSFMQQCNVEMFLPAIMYVVNQYQRVDAHFLHCSILSKTFPPWRERDLTCHTSHKTNEICEP